MSTWASLLQEYREEGIGPEILAELERIVRVALRSFPDHAGQNTSEDVLQDFVAEVLLRQGQLDWIFLNAPSEEDFRRLVAFHVRRHLVHISHRTVIDNLLDRCKRRLGEPQFERTQDVRPARYRLRGSTAPAREPEPEKLREAAILVAMLPRIRSQARERAPAIFSESTLERLLEAVAISLQCSFTLTDLRRVLSTGLTDLVVGPLMDIEGAQSRSDPQELLPEQEVISRQTATSILQRLTGAQTSVLAGKLAGLSDGDIARTVNRSRPTVARTKGDVLAILEEEMAPHSDLEREFVMDQLVLHLVDRVFE